tara:strand:- start:319 stop:2061 length:1743 start_codon:yes stop_codon:yes gene_type:complete
MSGAIAMGTSKITGLGDPTSAQDAATKTYVDTQVGGGLPTTGGTMTGAIAMSTNKITGMGDPTAAQDAATKTYVDGILGSATAASTSAAAALVSQNAAAASATAAATSETNSANSATSSAASSTTAAASLADFNTKYLGAHATAPTGTAAGQQYFNTTSDTMFVYTGSSWTEAGSAVNGTSNRVVVTATAAQTNFSISYDVGYVDVYLNGSKLQAGTDFTATNGATVVLTTGAAAGDIVDMVAYGAFNVANVYTQTESDARFAQLSNNLSDLASASTALTNLGLTADAAEINKLDGMTSSKAELNVLTGIPATLTPTEVGYVDGVTSAIQTQLDAKGTVSNLADLSITSTAAEINKLDALSRGSLIYGNASAETAILAKGTANQVLTSDGTDIAWANAAAGGTSGWEVLQTVTASGASTVDVGSSSIFDSTYDAYAIIGTNIKFSDDNNCFAGRIALGGTVQTTSYQMATAYFNSTGTTQPLEYTNTGGYIQFARSGVRDVSYASASIEVRIQTPATSGIMKAVQHHYYGVGSYNADTDCSYSHGVGQCGVSTNALTGFRFYPLSGTISGVFRVYGISKS